MSKKQYSYSVNSVSALPRSKRLRQAGYSAGSGGATINNTADLSGIMQRFDALESLLVPCDADNNELSLLDVADAVSLKAKVDLWSVGEITALGPGSGSSSGGSGATQLRMLDDVLINDSSLANGQALVYNGTHWVNQTIQQGLDTAQLAQYLMTNQYAKLGDIPSLTGYATQDWVGSQGFAKASALSGYVSKAGDTMTGVLNFGSTNCGIYNSGNLLALKAGNGLDKLVIAADTVRRSSQTDYVNLGTADIRWNTLYANTINVSSNALVSNLNADLIDGKHLSDILASNVASASRLATTSTYTAWGQTFFENGVPKNVDGAMTINYTGETGIALYRKEASSGAFMRLYNNNQESNYFRVGFYGDNHFGIAYNGTDSLSILTNGNVGVGRTPLYKFDVNGEIRSSAANAFRATYGNYGFFIRNDGSDIWFMLTNSGDINGSFNHLRPLRINNATGLVTIGNGLTVNNGLTVGSIKIGDGTITWDATNGAFKFDKPIYSLGEVTALGEGGGVSGSGGGASYDRLDSWSAYTSAMEGYVLSAKLGWDLYNNKADKSALSGYVRKWGTDGVLEVARYIDFHTISNGAIGSEDYTVRLDAGATATARAFTFPTSGGTLATESFVTGRGYLTASSLANYVDKTSVQEISGVKTFTLQVRMQGGNLMFKHGDTTNGVYLSGNSTGGLTFSQHSSYNWTKTIGRISGDGDATFNSFIKDGGTSSQFLKADGSVDSTAYLASSSYTANDVLAKLLTVDGSGSGLDADLLDGLHANTFVNRTAGDGTDNLAILKALHPSLADSVAHTVKLQHGSHSMAFGWFLNGYALANAYGGWFISDYHVPRWIGVANGAWEQHTFAFTDSNVASATKLQTARKLWGKLFDGTADIYGELTDVSTIKMNSYLFLTWGDGTKGQYFNCDANGSMSLSTHENYSYKSNILHILYNGNIGVGKTSDIDYKLDVNGQIRANGWLRTIGNVGWYNETYNGGWFMSDSTWIRTYNSKSIYSGTGQIRSDNFFDREGYTGASWNNGYGAYNVAIADNDQQTPLMVAYRAGQAPSVTGANRLFAMELLNNGNELRLGWGGSEKHHFYKNGNVKMRGDRLEIIGNGDGTVGLTTGIELCPVRGDDNNRYVKILAVAESAYANRCGLAIYTGRNDIASPERVRINWQGYVGINTPTPSELLDVNGTAKVVTLKIGGGTVTWDSTNNCFIFSHTVVSKNEITALG